MHFLSQTYSCSCVILLISSLFTNHASSAPIRRHARRDTSIWVTEFNTLNTTKPFDKRSLESRQFGGSGGFGGPGGGNPFGPETLTPLPPGSTAGIPSVFSTFTPPASETTVSVPTPDTTVSISQTTSNSAGSASTSGPSSAATTSSGSTVTASSTVSSIITTISSTPTTLSTTVTISASSTSSGSAAPTSTSAPPSGNGALTLSLVNSISSNNVHAYVTGLDSNGKLVLLATDNTFYYPSSPGTTDPQLITANVAIPMAGQGQTTQITIPDYISSGRIWFADGTLNFYVVDTQYGPGLVEPTAVNPNDPSADVNWGFIELTNNSEDGLFANLSFVDFVGLPLGMQLSTTSSGTQSALGLPPDSVSTVCNNLKGKASEDGQPWDSLCVSSSGGDLVRVIAPSNLISNSADSFNNYWESYVDAIWAQFTSQTLYVNTQSAPGNVSCTSSDNSTLNCEGDNRAYSKPSSTDIFGCNTGTFAIEDTDNDVHLAVVPRLCAAFNRATLHLPGGDVQPSLPPSMYYTAFPNNWYSAFVHQAEVDGRGYAFSYDDVTPNTGDDVAGIVAATDPDVLTVFVGGYSGSG